MPGEARRRKLRALVRRAGVKAADAGDLELVERAFVHESYVKERGGTSYERLEFLGDSVLGYITAAWVFEHFPDLPEGELTLRKAAIVNDAQLAVTAARLGFDSVLQLGFGMRNAGGASNPQILADAFEAFVAALFRTYGLETARYFVEKQHIATLDLSQAAIVDAKTRLQHYAQQSLGGTPVYTDESLGTPQEPLFAARVEVNDQVLGTGTGPSKKAARQAAADAALQLLPASKGTA